jgi:hypothetical protein
LAKDAVPKSWQLATIDGRWNSRSPLGPPAPPDPDPPGEPAEGFVPQSGFSVSGTFENADEVTISRSTGTFGTNSLKYAALGFGVGWMYSQPVGANFATHNSPFTDEVINAENGNRTIAVVDGVRCLFVESINALSLGAGTINWDTGGNIPENTELFISSVAKATLDGEQSSTQWKSYRIGPQANLGENPNSMYAKTFSSNPQGGEITAYNRGGSFATTWYQGAHPPRNVDAWMRHDLEVNVGAEGVVGAGPFSGTVLSRGWRVDSGLPFIERGFSRNTDINTGLSTTAGVLFYNTANSQRWRWVKCQDYINNSSNQRVWRTDLLYQYGTRARFELTDSSTYANSTESVIQLPMEWASTQVKVSAWRGFFSTFVGLYLWFIGADGSRELIGQIT